VEVIVIGCEGGTGLGEIETTHDEYPTGPFVPFLAGAFLVLVFAFVAFAGTTVFAHLSTLPDFAHVYDTPLALRFAPTLVHFVPEIDDVLEAVTSVVLAPAKAKAMISAATKFRRGGLGRFVMLPQSFVQYKFMVSGRGDQSRTKERDVFCMSHRSSASQQTLISQVRPEGLEPPTV